MKRTSFLRQAGILGFTLTVFGLKVLGCGSEPTYTYLIGETELIKSCASHEECAGGDPLMPGTVCTRGLCLCPDDVSFGYFCTDDGRNCQCRPRCGSVAEESSGAVGGEGGAGSGASVGMGGAGGAGGASAAPMCVTAADCAQPADLRCGYATCEAGACGLVITPGPTASQKRGDCKTLYCDTAGHVTEKPDLGDFYNDGKPCTLDTCEEDGKRNEPYPDGLTCPEVGSGVCYGGTCVECIQNKTECPAPSDACDGGFYCVPMSCAVNQTCGTGCAPCLPLLGPCAGPSDCIEGVCINNKCAIPSCQDGVQNDGETGIDCGAPSCAAKCPDDQGCGEPSDCDSGVCWGGVCQAPTCFDGVQNGKEAGDDCGGDCLLPCPSAP